MLSPDSTRIILLIAMAIIMVGLFVQRFKPTSIFAFTILMLTILQIVPVHELFLHMANESVITIFLLIFITSALKDNFNLIGLLDKMFMNIRNPRIFLFGFSSFVSGLSSLVNNTPVVALFIPYIYNWSKKKNFAPSKFLIPLSFAATLGGTITLIGTSTNLVLNGLMTSNGFEPFGFFDFLVPGLLVTISGIILITIVGYWLLPEHKDLLDNFSKEQRNYIVEMVVPESSEIANKTVAEAALRNLDGVYLVEINRGNRQISPVGPEQTLYKGDLLYFVGDIEKVAQLATSKKFGLEFPKTKEFDLGNELDLVEALVPAMSNLGGKKVKETDFRNRYDAAIVAIQRDGERLGGKIGDQVIKYGDLLLLAAGRDHRNKIRTSKNLHSLSNIDRISDDKKRSKNIFLVLLAAVGIGWFFNALSLVLGLMVLEIGLIALGLSSIEKVKEQFNFDLYIILVCAIVFGTTLITTGTADWITSFLLKFLNGASSTTILISLFITTVFFTSFVTNVAAVAIVFPIAASLMPQLAIPPTDVFLLVAFGASCSFLTPISYQTNVMVYEPGGYKGVDFLKIGIPLTVLYSLICIAYFV